MRGFVALLLVWPALACGQNVLFNTAHGQDEARAAVVAFLGGGILDTSIFINATTLNNQVSPVLMDAQIIAAAVNTGATYFDASNVPQNHAPYALFNTSFTGFDTDLEFAEYATLHTQQGFDNWSFVAGVASGQAQLPSHYASWAGTATQGGVSATGVEFTMTANYKGLDTSVASWVAAEGAALFQSIKFNHPTWNFQDIKGAVRQTASRWALGYSAAAFGYGTVDYDAANALASTAALFLQPPMMAVSVPSMGHMLITLYPYRQTRRADEVVYLVSRGYAWPVKNEYTTTDLSASGGVLIYTSNGTDVIPQVNLTISISPGLYNLIAFTADGSGNFSRVESFSLIPVTVTNNPCN